MQVTYRKLVESVSALSNLYKQPMPLRITGQIVPLVNAVNEALGTYNKIREKLIADAGDGPPSETDMLYLLSIEVTLRGEVIPLSSMPQTMTLTPVDLTALSWLIDIEK